MEAGALGWDFHYVAKAPFGEELSAGVGIRSASNGYSADFVRQKFTGYERDNETGLDFAEARYFSSVQGRFTSVDPLMASGRVGNPQSWNRYSYVLNRPLNGVDPSGMVPQLFGALDPHLFLALDRQQQQQQPQNVPVNISRTSATYNVTGQTASEAIVNAPKQAAAAGIPQEGCENGCTGLTHPNNNISYRWDPSSVTTTNTGAQAEVTLSGLAVNSVITVTLPNWTGYSSASQADQQAWDKFVSGVKDHEEGHVQIDTETLQAQGKALQALPTTFTATGTTAQAAVNRAGEIATARVKIAVGVTGMRGSDRSRNYDTVTRHGIVSRSGVIY